MANMQLHKTPMTEADPIERSHSFEEVAKGYSPEQAINEAKRCLNCKNRPCVSGCPVGVRIPEFIAKVAEGDFEGAYAVIKQTNSLPAVCGRVCPQESQCESKCVRSVKGESVAIGRLERFCADWHMAHAAESEQCTPAIDKNGKRVAVIGSGPSGLSCAESLARRGYEVTVFEAFHTAGGVLVYGIPQFRLPKEIVQAEIDELKKMGVEVLLDMVMGRIITVDELFAQGYDAVFVGTGAGLPRFLGIPGENSCGVYSANEFLTRVNLMKAYKAEYDTPLYQARSVAVVGGGNVAMDAARCAKRLGAERVMIVYRRGEEEMPARLEEIHHAKEEGIIFQMLTNPCEIIADEKGFAKQMVCDVMVLGEPDASGRRSPEPSGEKITLDVDCVIVAVGTSPNPLIRMTTPGLETDRRGCIVTEDGVTSSRPGVFAGGDAVTGAATVILAMGAGKKAADAIDAYIQSK
ncbi:MAG: NADPH-dependent glutamate synthase [Clostridia bacterium]|nr:NADPH-dependent glutamate synthase [Clostridia bacterium]